MKSSMSQARFAEIKAADALHSVPQRRELIAALDEAVAEIHRGRVAYELLAACVGQLDFDSTESVPPQTREQWIEFVRQVDVRAQALTEAEEIERAKEGETR